MSAEDILINITPQETRVAVLLAGVVQELHIERTTTRGMVGNIYAGRVARVLPGMQSAFIDIGLERAAFLHVADIWEARQYTNGDKPPIERLIHEGDILVVQVIKDPIGTKGARLSTQVSLAGRNLVYLPQESHIGVSQRIEDEAERAQLRERLTRLVPPDETGGYIVRTSAEDASEDDLRNDIDYLRKRWGQIRGATTQARRRPCSTRNCRWRSACCATWSPNRPRRCWSIRARISRCCSPSPRSSCRAWRRGSCTTPASGRCSTCT